MNIPLKTKYPIILPISMGVISAGATFLLLKNKLSPSRNILTSILVGSAIGIGEAYFGWITIGEK
jgi:hypothetical protein